MKQMSMQIRITLPLVIATAVLGVIGAIALGGKASSLVQKQVDSAKHNLVNTINSTQSQLHKEYSHQLETIERQALATAQIFSTDENVVTALEEASRGNRDDENDPIVRAARNRLKDSFRYTRDTYQEKMNMPLILHVHLPNSFSFARTWRDGWQASRNGEKVDVSDDLSSFRKTVNKVNATKEPVQGIEVGRGGFVIRGITPVFTKDGKHVGSNEVYYKYNDLFGPLTTPKVSWTSLMKKEYLSVAKSLQDPVKYPQYANSVLVATTSDEKLKRELFTHELVNALDNDGVKDTIVKIIIFIWNQFSILVEILREQLFRFSIFRKSCLTLNNLKLRERSR